MVPQERDLITTLLTRLKSAEGQPKDPEADGLIRQAMTEQPGAPYYLVQTVLIQDLSLHNAQNQIAELKQQLADAQAAPPQQSRSFLGGLLGGGQSAPAPAPQASGGPWSRSPQVANAPQQGYAPQYAPQPQYAQPQYAQQGYGPAAGTFGGAGGGFLRSAAMTAAGVAGGALLFEGISSLFGHNYASGLGGFGGMGMGGMGMQGGLGETVINNYGDSGGAGYGGGDAGGGDYGGGGGDYGGGGDAGGGDYGGGGDSGDYGGGGDVGGGGDFGGGGNPSC